jgi:hypothetical protein
MKISAQSILIIQGVTAILLCTLLFSGCMFMNKYTKKEESLGAMQRDMAERSAAEALAEMDEEDLRQQIDLGNIFEPGIEAKVSSIGIRLPAGQGLADSEKYLLTMVRTTLNTNFSKFAQGHITVTNVDEADEAALKEEVQKSLEGSDDELSLTSRISARALMTGTIIKVGEKLFNLDFRITDTEGHAILASYNKNHSDIELTGGIAVNKMTEYFLQELGVRLNDAGKLALLGNSNEAETALAKGRAAVDAGKGLEAMNYLYNAENFDTTKQEAAGSLAAVQTQNKEDLGAGAQIADFFERQDLWQGRLNEYNEFYRSHPPFELFYTPPTPSNMRGSGDSRAYDLAFKVGLRWSQTQIDIMERVLGEYILDGLYQNSRDDITTWELKGLPEDSDLFTGPGNFNFDLVINVENERGEVIISGPMTLNGSLYRYEDRIYADCTQELSATFPGIPYVKEQITPQLYIRIASINGIDIKTVGENGFTRVVQTQGKELPSAQANSLPKGLLAAKQKEIDAEAKRERDELAAAEKQEKDAAKAAEKERKRLEAQNNPLRQSRGGLTLTGGYPLGTEEIGIIDLGLFFGSSFWDMDFGVKFYPGLETSSLTAGYHRDTPAEEAKETHITLLGIDAGLSLAFVGRRWLLNAGGGLTFFIADAYIKIEDDSGSSSSSSSSSSSDTKSIKGDFFIIPYLELCFDLRLAGPFFLRAGYRMDIYPAEKFYTYFKTSEEKIMVSDMKFADNIFFGLALIF